MLKWGLPKFLQCYRSLVSFLEWLLRCLYCTSYRRILEKENIDYYNCNGGAKWIYRLLNL